MDDYVRYERILARMENGKKEKNEKDFNFLLFGKTKNWVERK
jgi:hypothetical protein